MSALQALIDFGSWHVRDYPEDEFDASLRRAFVDNNADYVVLDSNPRGQRFLAACIVWAGRKGLVYCDQATGDTLFPEERADGSVELTDRFSQSEVYSFRLTDAGRQHFGLAPVPPPTPSAPEDGGGE